MHIPDGLLPAQISAGGYALTGLATWFSLRQINCNPNPTASLPKASLLTAAFFVASSIHVPIPPASVHFVLNGLLGVILGVYAFPAILIGLFLQAVMLGHGGLTTLGVNAAMMGIPALLAYRLFYLRQWLPERSLKVRWIAALFAFLAGAIGLGMAVFIFFTLIITTIPSGFDAATERTAVYGLAIAHLPLMILEGIFTAMLVLFLQRIQPDLLQNEP